MCPARITWTAHLMLALLIPMIGAGQTVPDAAALVNPFIGSRLSSVHDYGKTVPGAVRPFGLLYWSPDMADEVFYTYDKPVTRGFSLTHISGPGCGLFGDAPIFPVLGGPQEPSSTKSTLYQATIDHAAEHAEPGYYQVTLDSGVDVRLAAQMRAGIAEFHFPSGPGNPTLRIDLGRNLTRVTMAEIQFQNRMITGSVSSGGICGRPTNRYQVFFAIEADQDLATYGTFDDDRVTPGSRGASGPHAGGYFGFAPTTRVVRIRVGISFVSVANAQANLRREIPEWDFEKVRKDARAAWNEALGRVQVKDGAENDRKVFYTALYHSLIHPTVFSDGNGEYLGFDGKVHTDGGHPQYSSFSGWDIYRSQVQLLAMLFPKEASDMAQSLVRDAEQGGALPRWATANDDSGSMVGDPSDGILASMYAFGARDFDTKAALAAMLCGANDPQLRFHAVLARPYLAEYLQHGYVRMSGRSVYGAASVSMEYQNADFAISRMADALGDSANARTFLLRSAQWRKLFDPETKYIRPRGPDDAFLPGFDPASGTGFVEGNAAQYTWMVPYDLAAVIEGIGGPEAARKRLDSFFSQNYDLRTQGPYFFIGNEPCFGNPWIYNWSGHPWRTQEVVRNVLKDLFTAGPEGLPGNDDLGATSSWVVLAQLGIYPEIPGVSGVTLNSPTFPEVTLRLGQRQLRITAPGAPSRLYVRRITLDGKPVRNWWIEWERLAKASKLDFSLSAEPSHDPGKPPPSFPPTVH
ncbi:MAG: GH92 family glycosyl hydrolase [Candidatus Solibacter sp.]|jgi:predicted alpha-1,2-mannosidase